MPTFERWNRARGPPKHGPRPSLPRRLPRRRGQRWQSVPSSSRRRSSKQIELPKGVASASGVGRPVFERDGVHSRGGQDVLARAYQHGLHRHRPFRAAGVSLHRCWTPSGGHQGKHCQYTTSAIRFRWVRFAGQANACYNTVKVSWGSITRIVSTFFAVASDVMQTIFGNVHFIEKKRHSWLRGGRAVLVGWWR